MAGESSRRTSINVVFISAAGADTSELEESYVNGSLQSQTFMIKVLSRLLLQNKNITFSLL